MKNKLLVYDDDCPLCVWYSSLFVRFGLLTPQGRVPFSSLEPSLLNVIDYNRSRNEIPLIDTDSGRVLYGIDALLALLSQRCSIIKSVGTIKPIHWLLRKFYKFISYNRKIIVAKKCSKGSIDCAPDFNYSYRLLFMALFLAFNTAMLYPLYSIILSHIPAFYLSINQLQAAHFMLVGTNCLLALTFKKEKAIDYLGQANMLAILCVLLLIPLMLLSLMVQFPVWLLLAYMALASLVVYKEYIRRMDYTGVIRDNHWVAGVNLACMTGFIVFLFS